ncbi:MULTISPECIES: chitobiase/beta-hexosaminidase C-terminal domain-containing protein [Emticicia]|uniref:chitobiase/beta-hexosaminidase C-terminal domain-containing protein n=1 Tax=Emticicia TaxID=312278 RepID=UPI0007D8C16D|nr:MULTISPECIES: chitobiase/beta-hexosaminidase C-terminal domain-containing protein [Emticicia]
MDRFYKISSYLLLSLNILLLFLLLFEEKVSLPVWMSPIGRMHPLLLHLPIGFVVLMVILTFLKNEFESKSYEAFQKLLLTLTAISAAVVALMGFFLSREGGYDESLLQIHKYTGVLVSFVSYLAIAFYDKFTSINYSNWVLLAVIAITGHFGAGITHGENYLFESLQSKAEAKKFTEENTVYEAAIFPILEAKCVACHNDQKTKGQLNMSSIEKILKGGKNGSIWKIGDALNSHIIQRANLPLEHKEHMPPKGKPQLSAEEIALLIAWINEGADTKKVIKNYASNSETKKLVAKLISANSTTQTSNNYDFSAASAAKIEEVNTPFCSVFALANGSPALQADFFVSKKFDRKSLENLSKVREQLVVLNLSKMPLKDEDLSLINFPNLEKLNLNQTDITGKTLEQLKKCQNLESLALAGTKVSKESLEKVLDLPKLKEIFIWNTPINESTINELARRYSKVRFDKGGVDNPNEILKLNPPILVNEEFIIKANTPIVLKHTLRDVKIRYTLDGTNPDSTTNLVYSKPIMISSYTKLKAIATKDNWYSSKMIEYSFYKATYTPDSVYLLTPTNPKYAGKGPKTITDFKKGAIDNFQEPAWLGFRENEMVALFEFKTPKPLKDMTVSYLQKMDSYIMPPASVEVWAGNSKNDLKLVKKIQPTMPTKMELNANIGLNVALGGGNYKLVKLIVKPIAKLPSWHPGKGDKAWFFVDEVFFN